MKRRSENFLLALALAAGAFWLQSMAAPMATYACSCAPSQGLEALAADGYSIVLATVERDNPGYTHTITVTHTFTGMAEVGEMRIGGVRPNTGDGCLVEALVGETWLTFGCTLNGRIGTDHGDALLAKATKLFGPVLPDTSTGGVAQPRDLMAEIGVPGWAGAAFAVGFGSLVFLLLLARWRPSRT